MLANFFNVNFVANRALTKNSKFLMVGSFGNSKLSIINLHKRVSHRMDLKKNATFLKKMFTSCSCKK